MVDMVDMVGRRIKETLTALSHRSFSPSLQASLHTRTHKYRQTHTHTHTHTHTLKNVNIKLSCLPAFQVLHKMKVFSLKKRNFYFQCLWCKSKSGKPYIWNISSAYQFYLIPKEHRAAGFIISDVLTGTTIAIRPALRPPVVISPSISGAGGGRFDIWLLRIKRAKKNSQRF